MNNKTLTVYFIVFSMLLVSVALFQVAVEAQTPNPCAVFACPTVTPSNSTSPQPSIGEPRLPLPTWFPDALALLIIVYGFLFVLNKYGVLDKWLHRKVKK